MKLKIKIISLLSFLIGTGAYSQQSLTMEKSIQLALKNNLLIKADEYNIQSFQQLKKSHSDIGKTNLLLTQGQYNSLNKDNNITISQTIPFPTVLAQQTKLGEVQTEGARLNLSVTKNELIYQVSSVYLQLSYLKSLHQLLLSQDSLYNSFVKASTLRYQTGESNLLEKTTAETQMMEIKNQVAQNEAEININRTQLQTFLNAGGLPDVSESIHKLDLNGMDSSLNQNPVLKYSQQQVVINRQSKKVEQGRFLPDITVGYFNQSLTGFQRINNDEVFFDRSKRFTGFQFGLSIPLWFVPQAGKAKAAYFTEKASQQKTEYVKASLKSSMIQAQQELVKNQTSLDYYETSALKNASLILQQANKAFQSGEIAYMEFLLATKNAHTIRANYLSVLNQYNQTVLRINYLSGGN